MSSSTPVPSLRQQAEMRAERARSDYREESYDFSQSVIQSPPPASSPSPYMTQSTPNMAQDARKLWRTHGTAVTQALEDQRTSHASPMQQNTVSLHVRVLPHAVERFDAAHKPFTAYQIRVERNQNAIYTVDRRYTDFYQLQKVLPTLLTRFPSKDPWRTALSRKDTIDSALSQYRCVQLDAWLVEAIQQYPQHPAVLAFLAATRPLPCNDVLDVAAIVQEYEPTRLARKIPTLRTRLAHAVHALSQVTRDSEIHQHLVQAAGLLFLTVSKAGVVVSGCRGTGFLVARRADAFSLPVAVTTWGMGWGVQLGGNVSQYIVVIESMQTVEEIAASKHSVSLGATLKRPQAAEGSNAVHVAKSIQLHKSQAYAVSSSGMWVGLSLDGSVLSIDNDANAIFYGQGVEALGVIQQQTQCMAARPLYDALQQLVMM